MYATPSSSHLGVDLKVQQELLRRADVQMKMNIYTQAVSEAKREENIKVVRMVLPFSGNNWKLPRKRLFKFWGAVMGAGSSSYSLQAIEMIGCGGPICTEYTILEHTVPQRVDSYRRINPLNRSVEFTFRHRGPSPLH